MTLNRMAKATAAALLTFAAGMATAADTGTLTVNATVTGVCKFFSVPAINFVVDPATVGAAGYSQTSAVKYRCTNGTAITFGGAGSYSMVDGAKTLPFTINALPAAGAVTGAGFAADATLNVTAVIAQADAQAAAEGNAYTKNVSLTISP